jgi:signal transduction histidine kinase
MACSRATREAQPVSLFSRVVAINAGVLISAAILLAVSPATVSSSLQLVEAVVLAVGTVLMITVNLLLMRRVFGPLEQLTKLMREVDPHAPGRRLTLDRADSEVTDLRDAFNAMLDRLEHERQHSGRRALAAQENERRRLARELHDEIGQTLTGVVLQLEALQRAAPAALQEAIIEAQETARGGVEDMREIARGLRRPRWTSSGCAARWCHLPRRSRIAAACTYARSSLRSCPGSRPSRISRSTACAGELDERRPSRRRPYRGPIAERDGRRRRNAARARRRARHRRS